MWTPASSMTPQETRRPTKNYQTSVTIKSKIDQHGLQDPSTSVCKDFLGGSGRALGTILAPRLPRKPKRFHKGRHACLSWGGSWAQNRAEFNINRKSRCSKSDQFWHWFWKGPWNYFGTTFGRFWGSSWGSRWPKNGSYILLLASCFENENHLQILCFPLQHCPLAFQLRSQLGHNLSHSLRKSIQRKIRLNGCSALGRILLSILGDE